MAILTLTGTASFGAASPFAGIPLTVPAVLILSGQSNWNGLSTNVPPTGPWPTNSFFWSVANNDFLLINPQNGFRSWSSPTRAIALSFEAAYPGRKLLIVESGRNGAGFSDNQFTPGGGASLDLEEVINTSMLHLRGVPSGYALWAFLFNQGEADTKTLAHANAYAAALSEFLTRVRSLTSTTLPRVLTRINASIMGSNYTNLGPVRAAQEVGGDRFVNVDAIPLIAGENLHYDAVGYVAVGSEQFKVLQSVKAELTPYVPPVVTSFGGLNASPPGWIAQSVSLSHAPDRTSLGPSGSNSWGQQLYLGPKAAWSEYLIDFMLGTKDAAIGVADNPQNWLNGGAGPSLMILGDGGVFRNGVAINYGTPFASGIKRRLRFVRSLNSITVFIYTANPDGSYPNVADQTFSGLAMSMPIAQPVFDVGYTTIDLLRVKLVN
jgi:Carbohydrate esterase, sialic acid-specific acetylesterase